MAILTIGRVGLDVDLNHPSQLRESRNVDSREMVLSGFIRSTSKANTEYLRDELLEQQGQVVAVTYTGDDHYDAFYLLQDVSIESIETSYLYRGLWLFEVVLLRIGGAGRVEFQSNITGTVLDNSVGLTEAEVTPWICPPDGHQAFNWVSGGGNFFREYDDGASGDQIRVYYSAGDFSADATWGANPSSFYDGAARLSIGGLARAGLDVEQDLDGWQLDNGIIRLKPNGAANAIEFSVWDTTGAAYESETEWEFQYNSSAQTFGYMAVLRNDPEAVTLRLMATSGRRTLDITLRRGAAYATCNFYAAVANTLKIARTSTEAGTAVTPTGATGTVGMRATSDDADGNRYVIFSPSGITNDTTNGAISKTSTTRINSAIGFEIDGSSAGTGDTADEVALQYFGNVGERVRAVWR